MNLLQYVWDLEEDFCDRMPSTAVKEPWSSGLLSVWLLKEKGRGLVIFMQNPCQGAGSLGIDKAGVVGNHLNCNGIFKFSFSSWGLWCTVTGVMSAELTAVQGSDADAGGNTIPNPSSRDCRRVTGFGLWNRWHWQEQTDGWAKYLWQNNLGERMSWRAWWSA